MRGNPRFGESSDKLVCKANRRFEVTNKSEVEISEKNCVYTPNSQVKTKQDQNRC
jgi:hypothetical protein